MYIPPKNRGMPEGSILNRRIDVCRGCAHYRAGLCGLCSGAEEWYDRLERGTWPQNRDGEPACMQTQEPDA